MVTDDTVKSGYGLDLGESSDGDEVGVDELVEDMEEWMSGVESEIGTVDVDKLNVLVTSAISDPNTAVECVSNSEDMKVLMDNLQHLKMNFPLCHVQLCVDSVPVLHQGIKIVYSSRQNWKLVASPCCT